MTSTHFIFEKLAELLAGMNPEKVLAFRTSEKAQERLDALLWKNKESKGLTETEKNELE